MKRFLYTRHSAQRALLFLLLLTFGCGEKIEPGTTSTTPPVVRNVAVTTAGMTEHPILYEAVGTVQAGLSINLGSKLMGAIETVNVREGDRVKAGQTLVVIDQRQVEAGFHQSEAGLAEAKKALQAAVSSRDAALASERLARATYDRYVTLKREDSVSAQEFDEVEAGHRRAQAAVAQAEAMVQSAIARIRQAEAGLASAAVSRKDAVITAPSDGVITAKRVEPGDLAAPGMTLISMDTVHGYRVDAVFPETYIEEVKAGGRVAIIVPSLGDEPIQAEIQLIVPAADQRTRSFLLKAPLPENLAARSGMFARVRIPVGRDRVLLIPPEAVVRQGQLTALFVVDAKGIAHFRLIRLGREFPQGVEVLSGLEPGERFAARLDPHLKDGVHVEVNS